MSYKICKKNQIACACSSEETDVVTCCSKRIPFQKQIDLHDLAHVCVGEQLSGLFGNSSATDATGDVVAVGSPTFDVTDPESNTTVEDSGIVYIYRRQISASRVKSSSYRLVQTLTAKEILPSVFFGGRVQISADASRIVVNARNFPNLTSSDEDKNSGAVFVYDWCTCSNRYELVQTIIAQKYSGENDFTIVPETDIDTFGVPLVLSGDGSTIFVGAQDSNSVAPTKTARFYIYFDKYRNSTTKRLEKTNCVENPFLFMQRLTLQTVKTDSGESSVTFLQGSIAITFDGKTIAFGNNNFFNVFIYNRPCVNVCSLNIPDDLWTWKQTMKIIGIPMVNLSFTPDGKFLAVERTNSVNGPIALVYKRVCSDTNVFSYQQASILTPEVSTINFPTDTTTSIQISADGCVVAVGAEFSDSVNPNRGRVIIFDKMVDGITTTWKQRQYIDQTPVALDTQLFGFSLAMSYDAATLVITGPGNLLLSGVAAVYTSNQIYTRLHTQKHAHAQTQTQTQTQTNVPGPN